MPGRHDAAHGSGAITSKRSPHQHTMSQQVRGSATHPDATKRVMTARTSPADSQQRSGKPRSETQRQATTPSNLARCQPIPMVRGDGPRKSKPGGPECACRSATIRKDPANSQSSATHPDAMKREPTVSNNVSMMERCNASRWNQTRTTNQTRRSALCLGKPCPDSHTQRPLSGCHEARPIQLPKHIDEPALPTKTPVFERHSP